METDPIKLAKLIAPILERLGVRYAIGGSVAVMVWGEPRATVDLDLMIEIDETSVRRLVDSLKTEFYVDEDDAVDAVRRYSSFNVIHFQTVTKVDFFVAEPSPRTRRELERRCAFDFDGQVLQFYSAEDIVVRKLMWYRLDNEVSDRQWRDIYTVLKVSGPNLDREYLARAAAEAGVTDLLERAVGEADR